MTFMAQLINFHKRLYEEFNSITTSPRVFLINSHQPEDPLRVVPRMLMENLYQGTQTSKLLDPRGLFIIQSKEEIRLWVGSQIHPSNLEEYKSCAESFIVLLQKYEKAPKRLSYVKQFEEDPSFWRMFGLEKTPDQAYGVINEWNLYFINLEEARKKEKKDCVVVQMQTYKEEVDEE
mmetsp:Transcript_23034/g.22397  ORF Transcript_23034/g.22397 Transcript_23034/m.22397 type:complete len:177 (+) Transcript_23034:1561-2091(+)